jgi:two-component system, NtrC family, sensor kinase
MSGTDDTNAREDALEELRRAERAATVSRLASHIAHELGTPLNVISGRATMIAEDGACSEETLKNAKIIVEQTTKLTAVIRQFLAEVRKPSSKEPSPVYELCERAIRLVERQATRAKVEVALETESERATIDIAPIKFVQVVTNLLTNAIKAMPQGGKVNISIKREERSTGKDRGKPGAKHVCVSIRDQGVGIAAEDIPNIFKLFYSNRDRSDGPGLGLSIVQGIVREHSGWIDVESEIGKGSLFTVVLPEGGAFDAGTHSDRR